MRVKMVFRDSAHCMYCPVADRRSTFRKITTPEGEQERKGREKGEWPVDKY